MVVLISYVGSQSTIHEIGIDLNAAPETAVVGDVYHSSNPSDHKVDSDNDPYVDEVPDDINDEGMNENDIFNASSVGNQIRRIVIHNNPGAHMSRIDPNAAHVVEFSEYPEIFPAHWIAVYSDPEGLFIGQRFESKEECVFSIKWHSMNISVDYNYRVSYQKTWIAKQMAMEQLYGDFNASYNELQEWIVAMREYVLGIVIELQTQSYYGLDEKLQPGKNFPMDIRRTWSRENSFLQTYGAYEFEPHILRKRMTRLEGDMEETIVHQPGIPLRSYGVDLRNRRCNCRRFQTLYYPCTHFVATCAKVSLNVDQFIDEVYTLECMLRVWENEFPVFLTSLLGRFLR
ncbi:hypothetical protein GOBAR_AA06177 [Gossypium barbadense]|uniref:SWIM-type domain-containing protein n=1 Tax=Gossypium barbadense TaxID=3634 RepID=A0A2P5YFP2_GOSBA|nr:hypothetical protein GOBAR_AA06177 [Gossypium barbadense]